MKTKVVKRDGSLEDYDEGKVVKVVIAAGIEPGQAQTVVSNVTKWIKDNNLPQVTSLQIRDEVLKNLKEVNPAAADLFIWYEGTKDGLDEPSSSK